MLHPSRGIRSKPSVELSKPHARSDPFHHSPKRLSTITSHSEINFELDGPADKKEDVSVSDTSSVLSMRISLASQGWVPDGNALTSEPTMIEDASSDKKEKADPKRTNPPSRSSWWGFSTPSTSQPASSWWPTFLAANESSSAPDLTLAIEEEVSCREVAVISKPQSPEQAVVKWEAGPSSDSSDLPENSPTEPSVLNNAATADPSPYPSSEPSFITRSLTSMVPTWRYFFTSSSAQHSIRNKAKPTAVEDNKDSALIQHFPSPPPSTQTSTPPTYKEANNQQSSTSSTHPNLVLPVLDVASLQFTYQPSLLRLAIDTFTQYTGIRLGEQTHLYARNTLSRPIRKVAVIGVHGWFPLKIYQKVVGEPTGTSDKFCRLMMESLQTYLRDHFGAELPEGAITQIPLQCEGKVEFRLNKLYSQLLSNSSWMAGLSDADHVLVAAHSQGTPVAIMLLDRLVRDGLLDPVTQRTCILAMAGVSHGPFPFLKENYIVKYFEAEAARELFEFMNPNSPIALRYKEAMTRVTESGIRVCAVASMVDQVVPLYSGVMHGFNHPSILRALYIDGVNYTPDFLTSLIVFALLLRNHGYSDNNLLLHLSDMVAGSLYSGTQGHSTIYEERKVYTAALQWHFSPGPSPAELRVEPVDAHQQLNPYYLPWIMRGLLDNPSVNRNPYLAKEMAELREQFVHWKPVSKILKELQFRLDPIKAQLYFFHKHLH
ncbi:hypothetical protein DSO57_1030244 [Entomophthora muscae]|uniref:Uncharacterized protein n=1 Tax=Entomophthora muscae TaxID=34485 RepID=A0ACC2TD39_9FUNG|nr:hypothetical protein DSO57_1030244 [Entomophthora muscae]